RISSREAARWDTAAACQGWDLDPFFAEKEKTQRSMQGVCRGCPVRLPCLKDVLGYEGGFYMRYGVAGGLTALQRRALHCEALLGSTPNLEQAAELASPAWASVMTPLRDQGLSPRETAAELRRGHRVIAAPVTVRVAVWWAGGKGSVLPGLGREGRFPWELVRDEARDVVDVLRGLGEGNRGIAAYLGVTTAVLGKAVHAWRAEARVLEEQALGVAV
ncbi:WhiB family transcriptional regulator, partial [Streptomyces scabiei]